MEVKTKVQPAITTYLGLEDIQALLAVGEYRPSRAMIMKMVKRGKLPPPLKERIGQRLAWVEADVIHSIQSLATTT